MTETHKSPTEIYKEIMENQGYEIIDKKSLSEQELHRIFSKYGNKIIRMLIIKKK